MNKNETLNLLRKADNNIKQLCASVCHLSGNPKKVRHEDFAAEIHAIIAALQNAA